MTVGEQTKLITTKWAADEKEEEEAGCLHFARNRVKWVGQESVKFESRMKKN